MRAMGQRLLALACITSATALQCHVGRAHDSDLKAHSDHFVDGVSLADVPQRRGRLLRDLRGQLGASARVALMTFRDRRCCTLEGNFYAVSDGACGSGGTCGNADGAAENDVRWIQARPARALHIQNVRRRRLQRCGRVRPRGRRRGGVSARDGRGGRFRRRRGVVFRGGVRAVFVVSPPCVISSAPVALIRAGL